MASCAGKNAQSQVEGSPKWEAHLEKVRASKKQAPPKKTQVELQELWRGQRSAFRAAWEDQCYQVFLVELEKRCDVTSDGCWEWKAQVSKPKKSATGYPVVKWKSKAH